MRLSIITPYYDTLDETLKLAEILEPQLTDEVEWIIIDDGCNEKELDKLKARVIHLKENSGGASKPRNVGLDEAQGEYIGFIDSDDMITNDYIHKVLRALKTDIVFISWKSKKHDVRITLKPPRWNCAVWCRVYKREIIGDIRFNEKLKIAEDWVFNSLIKYETSNCISKQIYIYNNGREGSLINGVKE